jgi:hypothetical protein
MKEYQFEGILKTSLNENRRTKTTIKMARTESNEVEFCWMRSPPKKKTLLPWINNLTLSSSSEPRHRKSRRLHFLIQYIGTPAINRRILLVDCISRTLAYILIGFSAVDVVMTLLSRPPSAPSGSRLDRRLPKITHPNAQMTVAAAIPPTTPATIDGVDLCCGSEIEDVDEALVDTALLDVVLGTPSRLEVVVLTTPDSTEVNVSVIGMVKLNNRN